MDGEHFNDLELPPQPPMTSEEKAAILYSYLLAVLDSAMGGGRR